VDHHHHHHVKKPHWIEVAFVIFVLLLILGTVAQR
jgi:hypothetical protein